MGMSYGFWLLVALVCARCAMMIVQLQTLVIVSVFIPFLFLLSISLVALVGRFQKPFVIWVTPKIYRLIEMLINDYSCVIWEIHSKKSDFIVSSLIKFALQFYFMRFFFQNNCSFFE